jgi:hypothetical protein
MAATRGAYVVGVATGGDAIVVVACVGASWRSDVVVVFTRGQRLRLHGLMVLSPVVVLVLWQLPLLVRGQMLLMLMVGEGLQLEV